jgi:hypothetical protein
MSQQINLFHPIFLRRRERFSGRALAVSGLVAAIGLAGLAGYLGWQVSAQRSALRQAESQRERASVRLAEATAQLTRRRDPGLVARASSLEAELEVRDRLLRLLQAGAFGNREGYSPYLVALARQHLAGVWLTGFEFGGAAESVTLRGRATNPELVPRYLQQLSREPVLQGIEFARFEMRRPPLSAGQGADAGLAAYVEYSVMTAAPES